MLLGHRLHTQTSTSWWIVYPNIAPFRPICCISHQHLKLRRSTTSASIFFHACSPRTSRSSRRSHHLPQKTEDIAASQQLLSLFVEERIKQKFDDNLSRQSVAQWRISVDKSANEVAKTESNLIWAHNLLEITRNRRDTKDLYMRIMYLQLIS